VRRVSQRSAAFVAKRRSGSLGPDGCFSIIATGSGSRYRRPMQADEALAAGVQMLSPLMEAHGFRFVPLASGKGSGGWSASGEFRRERDSELRRLELHFRQSLGLVRYHLNDASLSHSDYMQALKAKNRYPGFPDDPLDSFRELLHDLDSYAADFLDGDGDEFARCVAEADRFNALSGFQRLSEAG
jgi:hypothetical protein